MNEQQVSSLLENVNPLDLRIELFKKGDFSFIVEGYAANNEGDFKIGELAVHKKQKKALEILTDDIFDEFLYGGSAGGAKTWTAMCWLVFSCLAYPDTNYFVARNHLSDLLGSVYKTFVKVCKEYGVTNYKFNAQKNFIRFDNGSNIDLIEVSYKPSDPMYEDLGSTEYTAGFIEEVGEIHEMAAIVLSTRIGRQNNSKYNLRGKLFMTCNPKQNWAKTKFYDKHVNGSLYDENKIPLPNGRPSRQKIYLGCLVVENPFIDQNYIDGLMAKAIDHKPTYERLFKGNWDYEENPFQLADQESIENVFDNSHVLGDKTYVTCDVARFGRDKTVIIAWKGWIAKEILSYDESATTKVSEAVRYFMHKYRVPKTRLIIDADGIGGAVVDQTGGREFRNGGRPVKLNAQTPNYRNLQVQCLYLLAERINDGQIWIEADLTTNEKTEIKQEFTQIQSAPSKRGDSKLDCKHKGDIKSDIGRSPDYRDAFLMRVWFDLKPAKRSLMFSRKRTVI